MPIQIQITQVSTGWFHHLWRALQSRNTDCQKQTLSCLWSLDFLLHPHSYSVTNFQAVYSEGSKPETSRQMPQTRLFRDAQARANTGNKQEELELFCSNRQRKAPPGSLLFLLSLLPCFFPSFLPFSLLSSLYSFYFSSFLIHLPLSFLPSSL